MPWEDNMYEAHERKLTKYTELAAECRDKGWNALLYSFEVGCLGFIANSFQKRLRDLGFNRRGIKIVSRWVWSKYLQKGR